MELEVNRKHPFESRNKAEVAELVDALGSGPSVRKDVGVRIPASADFLSLNIN